MGRDLFLLTARSPFSLLSTHCVQVPREPRELRSAGQNQREEGPHPQPGRLAGPRAVGADVEGPLGARRGVPSPDRSRGLPGEDALKRHHPSGLRGRETGPLGWGREWAGGGDCRQAGLSQSRRSQDTSEVLLRKPRENPNRRAGGPPCPRGYGSPLLGAEGLGWLEGRAA